MIEIYTPQVGHRFTQTTNYLATLQRTRIRGFIHYPNLLPSLMMGKVGERLTLATQCLYTQRKHSLRNFPLLIGAVRKQFSAFIF